MNHDLFMSVTSGRPFISDYFETQQNFHFQTLQKFEEKVNQVAEGNNTILHLASLSGDLPCVEYIVENFPHLLKKVNAKQETALHIAARNRNNDVVAVLTLAAIENGAQGLVGEVNEDLDTALHLAVRSGDLDSVSYILEANEDYIYGQNCNGETPLYLAVDAGYNDIIHELCRKCSKPLPVGGPEGRTALHAAIKHRNKDFVDYIIRQDTSVVPLADDRGWTAIHYAAFYDWVEIVPDLLKCHTEDSDDDIVNTRNGAILIAAKEGHLSVIKGLLYIHKESDTGWDADFQKKNMLHVAVEHNQGEVVEFVLHNSYLNKYYCRGISFLNAQDYNGNTALHLSVMSGNFFPSLINHAKVSKTILNRMNLAPYDLLYVDDEIVGDQLQIKEAFDALRSNQRQPWKLKFWHKDKLELSSTKGSIKPTKRSSKNKIFNELRVQNMKEKVKLYQKRTNTQIIVAALITTVTFTVGFTMPGGYHQSGEVEEGFPVLTKKKAFAVFMAADAIALLFSTASLFLYFISSLYENAHKISTHILISTVLNIISIVAMMVTFMMGTYVVLAASTILTIFVYVISSIFFLFVIITLLKFRSDFKHGQIN